MVDQRSLGVFGVKKLGRTRALRNSWPGGPIRSERDAVRRGVRRGGRERARYPGGGEGVIAGEAIGKRARRGGMVR